MSIAKTAEVASQIVSPSRSAGIQLPSGTRTPEVVPFQVKTTSRAKSITSCAWQTPVATSQHPKIARHVPMDFPDFVAHMRVAAQIAKNVLQNG